MLIPFVTRLTTLVEGIIHRRGRPDETGEADLGDVTYEDALLDRQMRAFMQSENGSAEPPPDAYARVLSAIKLHQEQEAQVRVRARTSYRNSPFAGWREAFTATWAAGLRADKSRVLSGTVVALLLMLAVGPQVSQVLRGQSSGDSSYLYSDLAAGYEGNLEGLDGRNDSAPAPLFDDSSPDDAISGPRSTQHDQSSRDASSTSAVDQQRILLEMKTGEDLHTNVQPEAPRQTYPRPVSGPY